MRTFREGKQLHIIWYKEYLANTRDDWFMVSNNPMEDAGVQKICLFV